MDFPKLMQRKQTDRNSTETAEVEPFFKPQKTSAVAHPRERGTIAGNFQTLAKHSQCVSMWDMFQVLYLILHGTNLSMVFRS